MGATDLGRRAAVVPGGVYVNELGDDEGDNRVQQAYAGNYERLRTIRGSTTRTTCSA